MNWQSPKESKHLTLPKLTPKNAPVVCADTPLQIPIDDTFVDTWENGPKGSHRHDLQNALEILGKAFCRLAKAGQGQVKSHSKGEAVDVVTEIDTGIEMLLRLWLNRFYPDHKIIGEEGNKDAITENDAVWYIDPIDGTLNFVEGSDLVTMHIGCVQNNTILASFVGVPIKNTYYHIKNDQVYKEDTLVTPSTPPAQNTPIIATEYLDYREKEAQTYQDILKNFNAKGHRIRSIGINLIDFLEGKTDIFYKPATKFWDVLAPMALIKVATNNACKIEVDIRKDTSPLAPNNVLTYSPFSNDTRFVDHLNQRHQSDCRIGFTTVYWPHMAPIKDAIFTTLYT